MGSVNHETAQTHAEDLDQDLRDHLEMETRTTSTAECRREARYAALRKFGNVTRVKEETRAVWSVVWLEQLFQDIRFGIRTLWRSPGLTAAAVLAIALGIGVNVGVFCAEWGGPAPAPVPRAKQLVSVNQIFHGRFSRDIHGEGSSFPIPNTWTTATTTRLHRGSGL